MRLCAGEQAGVRGLRVSTCAQRAAFPRHSLSLHAQPAFQQVALMEG